MGRYLNRLAFGFSGLAAKKSWKRFRLYRAASALALRTLFRPPPGLPSSALSVRLEGLTLALPRGSSFVYANRSFELGTRKWLHRLLAPGKIFVDVGANIGFHTALAARRVGPSGRVVAVEPTPENLLFLRANLAANRLDHVEVLPYAAGSRAGRSRLYLHRQGTLNTLHPSASHGASESIEVEVKPLDELVRGPIDVVKIDTEGAEIEVLQGMSRLLAENPSVSVLVEWNRPRLALAGHRFEDLPKLLETRGFTVSVIAEATGALQPAEEVLDEAAAGRLAPDWFANCLAERDTGRGPAAAARRTPAA